MQRGGIATKLARRIASGPGESGAWRDFRGHTRILTHPRHQNARGGQMPPASLTCGARLGPSAIWRLTAPADSGQPARMATPPEISIAIVAAAALETLELLRPGAIAAANAKAKAKRDERS